MIPPTAGTERPILRPDLELASVGPDEIYVFSEARVWLWKAHPLVRLLPLLDGSRTLTQLLHDTASETSAFEVMFLLNALRNEGLVIDQSSSERDKPDTDSAFWGSLRASLPATSARPDAWSVSLRFLCEHSSNNDLKDALEQLAISVSGIRQRHLDVVLTDDYLRPQLEEINSAALTSGRPWMICRLIGQTAWIGPIFRPGHTGCWVCLQHRLRLNRQVEDFVARHAALSGPAIPFSAHPVGTRLASLVAAQEAALWLAGRADRLGGRLLSVSTGMARLECAHHDLVRRPQCPACGNSKLAPRDAPIDIAASTVAPLIPGGRIEIAEDALIRLRRHVDPLLGVVTWVRKLPQIGGSLIHNFAAGHNFSFGPDSVSWLRKSVASRTGGKGISETDAEITALGEAIERYSGVFRGDEARVRSTMTALGGSAIHPNDCMGFSSAQYESRTSDSVRARDFFQAVPTPFREDRAIDWSPLWSLSRREHRYLPTAYCYYGHPDADENFYCFADGNGCAAGSVLEEAILYAFFELVERDAAAIWWYNQIVRSAVNWQSFQDPYVERVADYCDRIGREFWVLDLTTDTLLPVFAAVSRRKSAAAEDIIFGLGAHLSARNALVHACTEHNQFLPAVSTCDRSGNTIYDWPDEDALRFWRNETIASQPQMTPSPHLPRRSCDDFALRPSADFASDIASCVEIVGKLGHEMLVLDQSRPDIDARVARVVVPGLRHFWRRLGPGRLYDVPVRLGWRTQPTSESEMNSTSIFF